MSFHFARVAIQSPLRRAFDYVLPTGVSPAPGARVRVPFGRGTRIGIVLELLTHTDVAPSKLKAISEVLDERPLYDSDLLAFLRWAADYFHHPIGEVVVGTLPALLRRGRETALKPVLSYALTDAGRGAPLSTMQKKAPRQYAIMQLLKDIVEPVTEERFAHQEGWRAPMKALLAKGFVDATPSSEPAKPAPPPNDDSDFELNAQQHDAVAAVTGKLGQFTAFLLDGVTGSGKTEVYLRLIEHVNRQGHQALVLIPEIGLTPQTAARFRARLSGSVSVFHSGLSDTQRMAAWLSARSGEASTVIGTRSCVFLPMRSLGLVIVDEEHDPSFKQQEGFRYSARDLAIVRARRSGVPVVLGTATPSLESLANVARGRYEVLHLPTRAGGAHTPRTDVIDVRNRHLDEGLSDALLAGMRESLDNGEQILLFLNRRGFAPVLLCHGCGWLSECPRCDAHMVYHRADRRVRCHHCASERAFPHECPSCGEANIKPVGLGTQRISDAISRHFPDANVARLDRDSVRRRGALEDVLGAMRAGDVDILIGTQMLAKGHHFPNVTLVGIVDADGGLYGADFRAGERMAQLLVQVSGRAGRGERAGRVILQTNHPHHPLLRLLVEHDYAHFAKAALAERRSACFPPYSHLALVRIEATAIDDALAFGEAVLQQAHDVGHDSVDVNGPVPAPMERRAGRHRVQILAESAERAPLHTFLSRWLQAIETLKSSRRVRWSLDVDPQELF